MWPASLLHQNGSVSHRSVSQSCRAVKVCLVHMYIAPSNVIIELPGRGPQIVAPSTYFLRITTCVCSPYCHFHTNMTGALR